MASLSHAENYTTLPLRHSIHLTEAGGSVEYSWEIQRQRFSLHAHPDGSSSLAADGSLEQFISEHYWGYSQRGNRTSLEYHDGAALYGSRFASILSQPRSAFIADGSAVLVYPTRRIT